MRSFVAAWLTITAALSVATVGSWLVGGLAAFRGPGAVRAASWPVLVAGIALTAGAVGWVAARRSDVTSLPLIGIVVLAWVTEAIVLALLGRFLDDDLGIEVVVPIWILATLGPLQPLAAGLGVVAARQMRSASSSVIRPS